MSKYGKTAVAAARLCASGAAAPRQAWDRAAVEVFGAGTSGQRKSSPRDAFLGLCAQGLVTGIEPGKYTRSLKNRAYAVEAVRILRQHPVLANQPPDLWRTLQAGRRKAHNGQMDVVVALWRHELIRSL
jgi:hypothetical protein